MLNGQCPRCKSRSVYRCKNGIVSGVKHTYVKGLGFTIPRSEKTTYVCTSCGYFENYLADKKILDKIAFKWEKV